jgi:hypothetical protein
MRCKCRSHGRATLTNWRRRHLIARLLSRWLASHTPPSAITPARNTWGSVWTSAPSRAANVAERHRRLGKEHHPKPREGGVERGRLEGCSCASAWTNRRRSHPWANPRANASTAADTSIPTTVPPGATAPARSNAVVPPPQPISRTLSPNFAASAFRARRPSGASCSSNNSRTSAHACTRASSSVSIGAKLLWFIEGFAYCS